MNYGCYMDSRFLLVSTPSGITLGPEGGAHQSINTPLIGMGQPVTVRKEGSKEVASRQVEVGGVEVAMVGR